MTFAVVERLTVRNLLRHVLPALALEPRPLAALVIEGTPAAWIMARLLGPALGVTWETFSYDFNELKDERGWAVKSRMLHHDLGEAHQAILELPEFREWLAARAGSPRLQSYAAKALLNTDAHNPRSLWRALNLLQASAAEGRRRGGGRPLVFLSRRPGMAGIVSYARGQGLRVAALPPLRDARDAARRLLGPFLLRAARLIRHGRAGALADKGLSRRGTRLLVDYYGQLNLERPELQSDFFFAQRAPLGEGRLLALFRVPRDPLTEERLAELRRHGMDGLAIDPAAARGEVPVFASRPSAAGRPGKAPAGPDGRWLRRQEGDFLADRAYWADLFERTGAKAYISFFKTDRSHCAISAGMDLAGGFTAQYQRSYEVHPCRESSLECDAYFAFGKGSAELCRLDGSSVPYHVVVGYVGDHRFPLLKAPANALRDSLRAKGARFIVSFFDENSFPDPRWNTGHEHVRRDYRFLLEKVLADPSLGVIFKPKVPRTLGARLGPEAALLAEAEATGRCHVFRGGELHAAHPPAAAALASDLVVHSALWAGTAGLEAALAGVPTLVLDRENWPPSPLYRLPPGKVVFPDWEPLWDAVCEHRRRAGGVPAFGDWSLILPELDPFRDGRAGERMGSFLRDALDGFSEGAGKDAALARAAERYAERWGPGWIEEVRRAPWGERPREAMRA